VSRTRSGYVHVSENVIRGFVLLHAASRTTGDYRTTMARAVWVLLLFLCCLERIHAISPSPGAEQSDCKRDKYEEWLGVAAREDGDTNKQTLEKLETSCRKQLDDLTRQMYGPPSLYKRWTVACNTECLEWDSLSETGRTLADCRCEELGTCEDTPMFWLCKYMFECRPLGITTEGLEDHRDNFCDACGTGQLNEIDFYDELDCGSASRSSFQSFLDAVSLLAALATLYLI
jgi:hypothetical protein